MSDSYSDPQQQAGQGDGGRDGQRSRGNRGGGREGGGFRIRLSDNVMVVVVAADLTMSVVAVGPVRIPLPDLPNPSRRLQLNRLPSRRPNKWWSRWWNQKQPPATTPTPQQPRPD